MNSFLYEPMDLFLYESNFVRTHFSRLKVETLRSWLTPCCYYSTANGSSIHGFSPKARPILLLMMTLQCCCKARRLGRELGLLIRPRLQPPHLALVIDIAPKTPVHACFFLMPFGGAQICKTPCVHNTIYSGRQQGEERHLEHRGTLRVADGLPFDILQP